MNRTLLYPAHSAIQSLFRNINEGLTYYSLVNAFFLHSNGPQDHSFLSAIPAHISSTLAWRQKKKIASPKSTTNFIFLLYRPTSKYNRSEMFLSTPMLRTGWYLKSSSMMTGSYYFQIQMNMSTLFYYEYQTPMKIMSSNAGIFFFKKIWVYSLIWKCVLSGRIFMS